MSQDIRVLIGDDDVNDRHFLEWGFRKLCPNAKLKFAKDGESVITYLQENPPPSFLILDPIMPRVDGFAVLTWLRSNPQFDQMPIVMLSGNMYKANLDQAAKFGVKEYVRKPDDFPGLLAVIEKWRDLYLAGI